jgi:tRNA dimethylallyltransferase
MDGLAPGDLEPAVPVLLLFGPTASGKTALLDRLFGGPDPVYPGEIVSADSMQVYRGLDAGTAKPGEEERKRLPHHLIDIRDPSEQFNAGDFVRLADESCRDIARRGKLPVVSGGTGFYLKNFVQGLPGAPPSNQAIREELREELERRGTGPLVEELTRVDPLSAERIHPNDHYRLLRALEVFRASGRPLSSFAPSGSAPREELGGEPPAGEGGRPRYRFLILGLWRDREELYRRIDRRCAAMFRGGLPAEVRRLFEEGRDPRDPGLRAIGYREFFVEEPGGAGASPRYRLSEDLPGVEALAARNSRRYAKRQITYFASIPGVRWIDAGRGEGAAAEEIQGELAAFFSAVSEGGDVYPGSSGLKLPPSFAP